MTKRWVRLPMKGTAVTMAIASGLAISAPASPPVPVPVQFASDFDLSTATSSIHDFVEPAIAASPVDPRNLVAGYFGERTLIDTSCFFRASRDGGVTWGPAGMLATRTSD